VLIIINYGRDFYKKVIGTQIWSHLVTLVTWSLGHIGHIGHMVFGGEEEGGGVRSRPGAARTILLFHIISARPSKQPRMVGSTLGVYSFGLIFVSARTNKRHHQHPVLLNLKSVLFL
jgi:hypothetical protein